MTSPLKLSAAVLVAGLAAACADHESGPIGGEAPSDGVLPMPNENGMMPVEQLPVTEKFKPTPEQVLMYMQYIGPALLGRTLSDAETDLLTQEGDAAMKPMFESWFAEPGFAEAVRGMMELKLSASGKRGDVDFGLAGYLVRHIVQNKQPWSTVLTSQTCYDAGDAPMPCDTGAPYTAGVLTTRGFLAGNEGRFNLSRAHTMLKTFMCRDYPHEETLQPRVETMRLKLMFRAMSAEDQKVAEAAGGFGNGLACYSCHGQFSLHAQPFVKFDKTGLYLPDATGLQNPTGQLGEGTNGTAASHWEAPELAKLEASQWFGAEIGSLAEGAAVIAKHDRFRECTLQHLLDLGIGINASYDTGLKGLKVDPTFLTEIASAVSAAMPDPTMQALATVLYADSRVIATTINGMKR
jgi:hypothetical protein